MTAVTVGMAGIGLAGVITVAVVVGHTAGADSSSTGTVTNNGSTDRGSSYPTLTGGSDSGSSGGNSSSGGSGGAATSGGS